jgi:DNA-binding NtrC family response regulator
LFFETAEISPNKYSIVPILKRLETIHNLQAIFLDILFGDDNQPLGLKILEVIRTKYPTLPIFILTNINDDYNILENCMELGANEYLLKMPTHDEIESMLNLYLRPNSLQRDYGIWGNSDQIRKVRALISRIATRSIHSVLIIGESGTGKELVARSIYRQSFRKTGRFIDKNCANEKSDLLDDDLFGHEKGAFTGADKQHIGRFERANGGILFLDEIGSMPLELQGKLLRVLETKEFQRIGGKENIYSDFQLICATNENPEKLLAENRLREDLYYRISKIQITLPTLRERKEDIPILAELFLNRFIYDTGGAYPARYFDKECLDNLMLYKWPGNIRELRNVIERAVIYSKDVIINNSCLPSELTNSPVDQKNEKTSQMILSEMEKDWPRQRILMELKIAIQAKDRIMKIKGNRWKAEFMRLMYPSYRAKSAKGFDDLIKRLTKGVWSFPNCGDDMEIKFLVDELMK